MLNESSTVQELLAEIHVQKEKLIKEKKLKKTNPLPPITDGEKPFEIPNGWKWIRLGELLYLVAGVSYKKNQISKSGIRLLRGGNIQTPNILFADDDIFLPQDFWNEEQSVQEDDIIIVASTGSETVIGKPGFARKAIPNTLIGAFLRICRPYSPQVADYLRMIFYSTYYRDYIRTIAKGANINNIRQEYIYNFVIPLPPLSEQHRLVARIESLFAKLDAAKEKVQSVLNSHETRKAALLHDAFTGKLTAKWREEQGISLVNWQTRSLSDCGTWKGGGTPSKAHPDYWENGEIMWVTSKDMKSDKIQDTQMHITPLGVEQSSAIYSEKPAVLFVTRSGILRHTLPVALVNRPFTTNQDLKSLTPNENIDTQYLFFAAKAFSGQILKTCMKNGTTVESINTKKLMEFLLPIASMREQKVIAKMLRQLLNKEQRARQTAEETLTAIDRMKQAILARAFRGEL